MSLKLQMVQAGQQRSSPARWPADTSINVSEHFYCDRSVFSWIPSSGSGHNQRFFLLMGCALREESLKTCFTSAVHAGTRSHGIKRAGSSTLLVEANALSDGLAQAEWIASWLGLAVTCHVKYQLRKRDEANRNLQNQALMRNPEDETCRLRSELHWRPGWGMMPMDCKLGDGLHEKETGKYHCSFVGAELGSLIP
eukprot:5686186-Amphidinium_carterae.3